MAIPPQSSPSKTSPLSSKWKRRKPLETKKRSLPKKATNPKQKAKKATSSAQPHDSQAKSAAMEKATEVQASLPSELPSFVKSMLPSHVAGGFWLGFPKKFCDVHLPKHDETVVLADEDEQEFNTKYLVHKAGLSGGWRGFSIAHKLLEGDALVFQLIERWKFKVYIVRVNGLNEIDGALGLLNLHPCCMNVVVKDSMSLQRAEDMDRDTYQKDALDNSGEDSDDVGSAVFRGLRFSQSVLEFKDTRGIKDFNIIVDGLVIDSEIPKHFRIKYYDLCRSQKTYLHANLLKGLNVKLDVGIILETVTIADAIRACKLSTTREEFETWDKTLKAFEEVGMKVGFLRDRISKLVGFLFESEEVLEAKRNEQVKAEEEMRVISKKLSRVREAIKNLDAEIETMKLKGDQLEPVFHKVAVAPW